MIKKTVTFLLLLAYLSTFAQDITLEEITNNILQIEADTTFTITTRNQAKSSQISLDGGYQFKIWHQGRHIAKIVEVIGLSYGSIQTTIYLTNHTPVKIIESEAVFTETSHGLNYNSLNKVYEVTHDILNWNHQKTITKEKGKRVFSVPKKAILDYKLLIECAKQTIDE